ALSIAVILAQGGPMRGGWLAGALLLTLAARPGGAAEAPQLLRDIVKQPGPALYLLGLPEGFVQVNDRLVFSTPGGDLGDAGVLWSTDGSAEGTNAIASSICLARCDGIASVATWPGAALLKT